MKRTLKRLSAVFLCAVLVLSLASCGKKETCIECASKCSDKYQSTTGFLCKECYQMLVSYLD